MSYYNDEDAYSVDDYYVLVTEIPQIVAQKTCQSEFFHEDTYKDAPFYMISLFRVDEKDLNQVVFVYSGYNEDGSDVVVNSLVVSCPNDDPHVGLLKTDSQKGLIPVKDACYDAVAEFYDPETEKFNLNPYVLRKAI